eukprot:GHVS01049819.1.p1 GENE.GHVS01049819.1~~GHVS01049819.1.p1  ORF type:complete len:211 (-),score=34.46 GHVS01049819.1:189-821(-)
MSGSNFLLKLRTASLQSGSVMFIADMIAQGIENNNKQPPPCSNWWTVHWWEPLRSLRWAVVGCSLHGPFFFTALGAVDRLLGSSTSIRVVLAKTAIAQLVFFPPYLCALFPYLLFLESPLSSSSLTLSEYVQHIYLKVPSAFQTGCIFWPIANIANFLLLSPKHRVLFLALSAGVWNTYLSDYNHRRSCQHHHHRRSCQNKTARRSSSFG